MLGTAHADAIRMRQQVQHRRHDQGATCGADREHDLLPPGCRADQVAGLQVLQVVAADARRAADDRADHDRGHGTDRRAFAHEHEQQQQDSEDAYQWQEQIEIDFVLFGECNFKVIRDGKCFQNRKSLY